ncbi:hypothetical protein JOF59_006124 [Streptomyces clavifer]|uniref:CobW C-terminal domain-containing protein n=3 Tax=Streptomyces TaxID=1883 RepID=A0ABS4VIC7_9ACTN|nr:hypothetical protein [Streptomyces clavifer]
MILRQDLLSLRRTAGSDHVILALPENLDILAFLVELWRTRSGATSLGHHYARRRSWWVSTRRRSWLTSVAYTRPFACGTAGTARLRSRRPRLLHGRSSPPMCSTCPREGRRQRVRIRCGVPGRADQRYRSAFRPVRRREAPYAYPLSADFGEQWLARLDSMVIPGIRRGSTHLEPSVESVRWRARRPVHPQRLADALAKVMRGVTRSRGHLWLSSRPDSVVTWRSAGAHLDLR